MSWAIREIARGEFLKLSGVRIAAQAGTLCSIMAIGLNAFGHTPKQNALTAAFTIVAVGGFVYTLIGIVAFAILATAFQKGNERAMHW